MSNIRIRCKFTKCVCIILEHRPIGLATKNYDKPQLTTRTKNKKQIEHVEQRLYREDPVPEYFRGKYNSLHKI